ncbi:TPA: hypothetical protein N0F65_009534 [Lagenidium giganteum]|uniref:Uncharacterized protein n=1 Tax=Lagenidium giganteum TaxID=4803 RepID=A0AAV2YVA8_9STRA|nr:TPA: hypothetical protein N0F65_009534 [Lagenidium giganteum]
MAAALVDKGEELASHMQLVIAHARGNDSIDKFKKVVEYIELEILDFERLVQLIAHTELPPSNQPQEHVSPPPTAASTTATVSQDPKSIPPANSPARGAAVSYDLPSMKQYCEKVAPSYTAYLKPKATRSRFARR